MIVGYRTREPGHYVCLDAECLALKADIITAVVHAGEDAVDEGRFLRCTSCCETLDERAEILFLLEAPIPQPWASKRGRELGMFP